MERIIFSPQKLLYHTRGNKRSLYSTYLTCILAFLEITNLITQKPSSRSQQHFKHLKLAFGFVMLGNTTAMSTLTQQRPTWLNTLPFSALFNLLLRHHNS